MGDWHDSVVANDEETGSIRSTDQVGRVKPRIKKGGEKFGCALTQDRLMGDPAGTGREKADGF